jgi:hypothetical protein
VVYAEAHKRRKENQGLWQGYGQNQVVLLMDKEHVNRKQPKTKER